MSTNTASLALTHDDLASALAAVEALGADDDFATWCDARRDAWVEAVEASGVDATVAP